jgi:hypothetical protein
MSHSFVGIFFLRFDLVYEKMATYVVSKFFLF